MCSLGCAGMFSRSWGRGRKKRAPQRSKRCGAQDRRGSSDRGAVELRTGHDAALCVLWSPRPARKQRSRRCGDGGGGEVRAGALPSLGCWQIQRLVALGALLQKKWCSARCCRRSGAGRAAAAEVALGALLQKKRRSARCCRRSGARRAAEEEEELEALLRQGRAADAGEPSGCARDERAQRLIG